MSDPVPKSKAANRLIVVGVAILVWFVTLLAMSEAFEIAGVYVLPVALIPAIAAAMITAGILMRLSN
jgi:hypothetical protein